MKMTIKDRTKKNTRRRNGVRKPLLGLISVGLALTCLSGCAKKKAHYEDVQRRAEKFFKEKYGEKASVVSSKAAGNSGLFGYVSVKDRAYEMSDGTMVYWNDEAQYFADNRQAEEIAAALTSRVIEPALAAMDPDCRVSDYSFNRTEMDSFDEMVYREYFDGDLEAFSEKEVPLQKPERPKISRRCLTRLITRCRRTPRRTKKAVTPCGTEGTSRERC